MQKLSVAMAVYNEASNIRSCLDSVKDWVQEIVIVDGGSTDDTVNIAREYTSKIIRTNNPPIFHLNKQKALEACREDWILQLDADETVSEALRDEIKKTVNSSQVSNAYYLPRKNFFLGHWLHKSGQYPDYVIRLFRNGKGKFPSKSVHEQIEVVGPTGYLKNSLDHYSFHSIGEYWKKAWTYISLTAMEMSEQQLRKNFGNGLYYFILKPLSTFISIFFRHKGFLDGIYGFLFALFSALHYPLAYNKYLYYKLID